MFSQSFLMGEDTLRELERGPMRNAAAQMHAGNLLTPPCKRKYNNNNNNKLSGEKKTNLNESDDIIEDSPTDKSNLAYKSIKERLRKVSSRSNGSRKHLRRSKSDPVTPIHLKRKDRSELHSDFGSMFDSTMDYVSRIEEENLDPNNLQPQQTKSKDSNERNAFSESIDQYFQESIDCFTQLRDIERNNGGIPSAEVPLISPGLNENISAVALISPGLNGNISEFFQSQFTMETKNNDDDAVNVSEIEKMMNTQRSLLPVINELSVTEANRSSEDIFGVGNGLNNMRPAKQAESDRISISSSCDLDVRVIPSTQDMSKIHWDESEFFNDFDPSEEAKNKELDGNEPDSNRVNENIVVDGSMKDNLDGTIADFIDEEIECCKIDVSMALSEAFQSPVTSTQQMDVSATPKRQPNSSLFPIHSQNEDIANIALANNGSGQTKEMTELEDDRNIKSLSKWGFSRFILEEYKKKGIRQMFEWQAECLSNTKVRNEGSNLVYSAPTSAGKTFVSEILMIRNVVQKQKKTLVILPFISVVREKMYYLQDLLRSSGIRVEGFFGGYSPPGGFDSVDIAVCTIEKANSIINKLLEQNKLNTIGVIVVDEIHLISDPGRGYILELLLTKAIFCSKKLQTNIQIVTMSATLPNSELLTKWLKAEYYYTDFRPVALQEMIKIGNEIFDKDMKLVRTISAAEYTDFEKDQDNIGQLCIETILEGSAVIVFCPSKDWCESLSLHIAGYIYRIGKSRTALGEQLRTKINMELIEDLKSHLKNSPTGLDSVLEKIISYGVAYHHAGLTFDERDIIESAFSNGSLRVIIATSTLSSGVNLPARRVIIRSPLFFGKTMSSLTYKQMIGRAGRTGKDTVGESILICSGNNVNAGKELVSAELKPLTSCLDADNYAHLKRAILEIIAAGMAITKQDLEDFIKTTLLHSERNFEIKYFAEENVVAAARRTRSGKLIKNTSNSKVDEEMDPIGRCMLFLEEYEFIRMHFNEDTQEMNYIATRLGHACLASSMPPGEGFLLFSELQKARQCFVLETELHAVYLVTPFSVCYQLQEIDWLSYLDMWEKLSNSMRQVGTLVGVKESFLVKAMRGGTKLDYKALQIHKRFYTALALLELVNETPINNVAAKYKFSRGVLQSLQQITSTFAGIVTSFCRALNWEMLAIIISQFKERLFFGVHQDLIDLMKIPILNSQRARALHAAGFQTLIDIANADMFSIEKCLYDCISFDSKQRDGESNYDAEQRNKQRALFVTGKAGLSVKEAAKMIIDEARAYLENEMRLTNVKWVDKGQENGKESTTAEGRSQNYSAASTKEAAGNTNGESKRKSLEKTDEKTARKSRENCGHEGVSLPQERPASRATEKSFNKLNGPVKALTIPEQEASISINQPKKAITQKTVFIEPNNVATKTPKSIKIAPKADAVESDDDQVDVISFDSHTDCDLESQSLIMNSSHILCDNKIEAAAANFTHINIIDVFQNKLYFAKFEEDFESLTECSLSLAPQKQNPLNKNNDHNCVVSAETYIEGISICFESNVVFYLNLQDNDDLDVKWDERVSFLKNLLSREEFTLKICNAREQLKMLQKAIPEIDDVSCSLEDPRVAHWLLQPDTDSSLNRMALSYSPECVALTRTLPDQEVTLISPKHRASIEACVTLHLLRGQLQNFNRMGNGILKSFKDMEMPIQKTLLCMENTGIAVNRHLMENLNLEINDHMRLLEQDMTKLNGKPFRVNSRQEIARILRIPNAKGNVIPRAEIEKSTHPIAKLLLQHRSLGAILGKTIQPLLKTIVGNRIYGTNISFTSTGRISMHEPNLQTVAKDFDMEFLDSTKNQTLSCRKVFQTESGRELISADFCQLELRILAHLSEDKSLINIFKSEDDVFTAIAAKWNKIPPSGVTENVRNAAKQICYGIIYGMGAKSLAVALKCDEDEANTLSESFHKTYPGIRNYTNKIVEFAREHGYVETLAGRRRYLPFINQTTDLGNRHKSERQAINTKVQGSAADIAKYAMIRMERNIRKYKEKIKVDIPNNPMSRVFLVLHLHDELIYEVPVEKSSNVAKILRSSMENCAQLNVPLKVKLKAGRSWGNMKTL